MRAIRVDTLDPAYNLALEETLYNALEPGDEGWFLLWRNGPSIIVGRHQNTLEEINESFVRENNIQVVRRPTGGGAVYHDAGNVNFSFLTTLGPKDKPEFSHYLAPIVEALGDLGLSAAFSSRNDITVNDRKVSGSAQRRSGYRMLHHGTMMVDLDMSVLGDALTGNPDKYQSKGVASHRSRVGNLREFLPPGWSTEKCMEEVIQAMLKRCAACVVPLDAELSGKVEQLADTKYRTWEWNYGHSPEFTEKRRHRFPWGALECRVNVKNGLVRTWRIYGDFFSLEEIGNLEAMLTGIKFTPDDVLQALADVPVEAWFAGAERADVLNFLAHGIPPSPMDRACGA